MTVSSGERAHAGLLSLGLVDPEQIRAARDTWDVLAIALMQARARVEADRSGAGGWWGGTYRQAARALTWLLSADAYAWMEQVNAGPVVPGILSKIRYREIFSAIRNAADRSPTGREWLEGVDFHTLERLVKEADDHFAGRTGSLLVAVR